MDSTTQTDIIALAVDIAEFIGAGRVDDAAQSWDRLRQIAPAAERDPTFPVLMAIRAGRPADGLHLLSEHPEDRWPELRAMCLHAMDDPIWESYARENEDSPDPGVRAAMRRLLGRPTEIGP